MVKYDNTADNKKTNSAAIAIVLSSWIMDSSLFFAPEGAPLLFLWHLRDFLFVSDDVVDDFSFAMVSK
jgi:hypothetical protein